MIQQVQFRNFKAYRSLDLELEPFTVLVGPNASGKTTLLEGLRLITALAAHIDRGDSTTNEDSSIRSFGVSEPMELAVSGFWGNTRGRLAAVSETPQKDDRGDVTRFKLSGHWGADDFPARRESPALQQFRAALSSTAVLRFEPQRLAESSYSDELVPGIGPDGSGLASVLAYLKLSQDEVFDRVEQALRQVVPAVKRIRIERAKVPSRPGNNIAIGALWGHQVVLDMRGAKGVNANSAGEGTLMALALLTVLMGPTQPQLVLLDDIELSLHPAAQGKLIESLREIQKKNPQLQIVATSHSPFVLNYLEAKEVRMTFLAENGFARCEKLTAHPEFEKWKDLMTPGEFWSTVGESWLEKAGEASVSE